jgi:hypothetical protein
VGVTVLARNQWYFTKDVGKKSDPDCIQIVSRWNLNIHAKTILISLALSLCIYIYIHVYIYILVGEFPNNPKDQDELFQ